MRHLEGHHLDDALEAKADGQFDWISGEKRPDCIMSFYRVLPCERSGPDPHHRLRGKILRCCEWASHEDAGRDYDVLSGEDLAEFMYRHNIH
jgi:hypothetical protein